MKTFSFIASVLITLAVCAGARAQTTGAAPAKTGETAGTNVKPATGSKTEQELMKITQELTEASKRGDKKVFETYLAENYFSTSIDGKVNKRAQILENMNTTPAVNRTTTDFEDVMVREQGNTAVLNLKFNNRSELNGQKFVQSYRATDVFTKQDGRWQILSRHVSIIPADKMLATVNPAVYDAYTGQYEINPDVTLTITREGDKLIGQFTADKNKIELLPENETTFFEKGLRRQTIFVKDETGKVSHIIHRLSDGQEVKRKKIK